jgi:hypothetical protein
VVDSTTSPVDGGVIRYDVVLLRVLLVLIAALLVPHVASACDCIKLKGPIIRPGSKAIVATARVIRVGAADQSGLVSADIEIREAFLNTRVGRRVTVYTRWDEAACGYPHLRQGEDYLIITDYIEAKASMWRTLPTPNHTVGLCGGTKVLNTPEGQKMLAAIREEKARDRRK